MYLKPTDLGPIYKEPILAEVYFAVLRNPDQYNESNYLNIRSQMEANSAKGGFEIQGFLEHCLNRYLHDRLQQIDPKVKVDKKIMLKVVYEKEFL